MKKENKSIESNQRTITKTCLMKIIEISISAIIIQVIFKQPFYSFGLPILLEGLQMFAYFLHERMWNRISWGKKDKCPECHYRKVHLRLKKERKSHEE